MINTIRPGTCRTERGLVEYSFSGTGPTVLIFHGGHSSCLGDYGQDALIEAGFSVLIPTRPGYGGTPIESGKTAGATADLVASLVRTLGLERVSVIGNSAGGPASLEFAGRYPELTEKLILEDAVIKPWYHRLTVQRYAIKWIFHPRRQARFWARLRSKCERDREGTLKKNLKLFTTLDPGYVLGAMDEADIERLVTAMVSGNDSGFGFIFDVDHRAKNIEAVTCPTLIIHSKNDGSVPFSHAEYAKAKIANSQLYVAPTYSHFIYFGPGSEAVIQRRVEYLRA